MVNYYTVDLAAWNDGTYGFSYEEEHVYRKLCERIYEKDDHLLDDDRDNAALCKMSLRRYRKHRQTLLDAGKIMVSDGHIRNERCTAELQKIFEKSGKARDKAEKSHRKRRQNKKKKTVSGQKKSSKNNGTEVATAIAPADAPAVANSELVIVKEETSPSEKSADGLPEYPTSLWNLAKEVLGGAGQLGQLRAKCMPADDAAALLARAAAHPAPDKLMGMAIRDYEGPPPKLSFSRREALAEKAQLMREIRAEAEFWND
jgi:uncharacterized protein YdaU (DUF1376 family)